jgi:hypothetical protein
MHLQIKHIHITKNKLITQDIYTWLQFWHGTHRKSARNECRLIIIWPHLIPGHNPKNKNKDPNKQNHADYKNINKEHKQL